MSITSYSLNEDCRIKFVDGTATTPFEMEIFGVEPGTEIAPGVRNTPQRRIVHRGNTFAGYKRDLDEVPEVTMEFTAKVFDDDFKASPNSMSGLSGYIYRISDLCIPFMGV